MHKYLKIQMYIVIDKHYICIYITRERFPRFVLQERSLAGGTVADFNIGLYT